MENITANEVAGLGVGALLLAAALATPKVDAFIARAQRRELKLCMECGGVTRIPCARCKARGTLNESIFGSSKPVSCPACRGKGNFPCPCCSGNKSTSSSSSLVHFECGLCGVVVWPVKMSCLLYAWTGVTRACGRACDHLSCSLCYDYVVNSACNVSALVCCSACNVSALVCCSACKEMCQLLGQPATCSITVVLFTKINLQEV